MKILLILAGDNTYRHNGFIYNKSLYAPLTLSTLAALVPEELNPEIQIIDEGVQRLDYSKQHWDVVGITCCASSAPRAYELACFFRARNTLVVLGGSHPSLNPEEAAENGDCVVAGYAEESWPALLRAHAAGETLQRIYHSPAPRELPAVPPRRDLIPDSIYLTKNTVIASRGCANRCDFCAIHTMWDRSPCVRPVAEVMDEIKSLPNKKVLFLDPNLTASRTYARELMEALIPLKIKWRGLATLDMTKDAEMMRLATASGCYGILAGFETMNQANLLAAAKPIQQVDEYKEAVRIFHESGISVLGCFVLGFDEDTKETFRSIADFIDEVGIDLTRFSILTPYPGTDLYKKLDAENRIISRDLTEYDTEHVVFRPAQMSPEELLAGYRSAWKDLYRSRRIMRRAMRAESLGAGLVSLAGNLIFKYHFPTRKHRE
jgi:radical SAM superfamily enzyme YgiQ (UPF0313 family)